jgi:hypothetical protein
MNIADDTRVRFSRVRFTAGERQETRMLRAKTFKGLGKTDRKVLTDWLARAGAGEIDTVIDLSGRPWNVANASLIVGVYETDKADASWLIVRDGTSWALARCADGFISDGSMSLSDILALISRDINP